MKTKAGACQVCGSTNTELSVRRNGDGYVAQGKCLECGFEDMKLRGDDPDLLADVARSSFGTVHTSGGSEVSGLPTAKELAREISMLATCLCRSHARCEECQIHNTCEPSSSPNGEGYYRDRSSLGLGCDTTDCPSVVKRLMAMFPSLDLGD